MNLQAVMNPETSTDKVVHEPNKLIKKVEYRIGPNQVLTGIFVFKDMTLGEQAEYEIRRARLTRGLSFESFSFEAQELFSAIALLGIVIEKAPDWYDSTGNSPYIKSDLILALAAAYWEWQQSLFRERTKDREGEEKKSAVVLGDVTS